MTDKDTSLKQNSYEMVCSLGERCMTAHQMRLNKLRSESNPFDWLITTNINAVVNTILDGWKHFFQKENLIIEYKNGDHLKVTDLTTGFISLHDFNSNIPFDEEYNKFIDKYTQRINRFMNLIQSKNSILFVRNNVNNNDIDTLLRLTQLNPKAKIDFLIVNTTDTRNVKQLPSSKSNVAIYEISNQPDLSYDFWMGNHSHWKTVLSHYSLIGYQDWLVQALKKYVCNKTLVIWGFGGAGRKIVSHLLAAKDSVEIGWIVDSNSDKIGKISDTLEIKDISSLQTHINDVFVLICIYGDTTEIEYTLKKMQFYQDSFKKVIYEGQMPINIG